MNQTFSITRFGRLLRKYLTDNRGQLLANIGLLAGLLIMATLMFYRPFPQAVDHNRNVPFFAIGWSAWYVFTWQQTENINQKERALTYFLQPASQLEKISLIWLVSGLGFIVVYLSLFGLTDAVGVSYVNHKQWTPEQQKIVGSYQLASAYSSDSFWESPTILWVFSALLHPFALAFSLLIRRYTLPLVAILAFGLFICGLLLNTTILEGIIGSGGVANSFPFSDFDAYSPLDQFRQFQVRTVDLPQPIGNQIRYLVGITAVILLYITAYVRLKEREV